MSRLQHTTLSLVAVASSPVTKARPPGDLLLRPPCGYSLLSWVTSLLEEGVIRPLHAEYSTEHTFTEVVLTDVDVRSGPLGMHVYRTAAISCIGTSRSRSFIGRPES